MSVMAIFQQLRVQFEKSFNLKPSLISAASQQVRSKRDPAQRDDTIAILGSWYKPSPLTMSKSTRQLIGSIHELKKTAGTSISQKPRR
jgi:hypothetical protein